MSRSPIPIRVLDLPPDSRAAAAMLNRDCYCQTVDHAELRRALEGDELQENGLSYADLLATRPHLFSDTRVYVADAHLEFMARLIEAIERIIALPAWRERVLAYAPEIAAYPPKSAGVFLGYDFHVGVDGPRLIEINTNAGAACLTPSCSVPSCRAARNWPRGVPAGIRSKVILWAMFRNEWRLARGERPLRSIAIVDETPGTQFLAAEFELFRQLFAANGIVAWVLSPDELRFDGRHLRVGDECIDLVYNRLTDFALELASNAALRAAYLADAVVLTPHPHAHALYADKRNLVALTDDSWLQAIGLSEGDRRLLHDGVPRTEEVLPENAPSYWASRKQWFFKPAAGYGSKATYRGDKLTRRVFDEIAAGGYVAQALVMPSERSLRVDDVDHKFKLDLRNYVYQGQVQLVSARLYQGQTTNFRTRGGGFSAVFPVSSQHPLV